MWTTWSDFDRSFAALDQLRRRMDRLFADVDRAGGGLGAPAQAFPRVNLFDEGSAIVLYAAVPGLSERDLELTATQDTLSLSGTRRTEVPEGYSVHRRERGDYQFSRSFALPCRIDVEKVAASVKDGVLTVRMSKAADAQPRQITVKAS